MEEQNMNIIDDIIQAIALLNKTDEYLESLYDRLSKSYSLVSDYEHFIENTPVDEVNLKKLYKDMQSNFIKRRNIKNEITIKDKYEPLIANFNNKTNREFLIQSLKNVQSKLGVKYHNKILTQKDTEELKQIDEVKRRGRPKKVKEGI